MPTTVDDAAAVRSSTRRARQQRYYAAHRVAILARGRARRASNTSAHTKLVRRVRHLAGRAAHNGEDAMAAALRLLAVGGALAKAASSDDNAAVTHATADASSSR